MHVRTHFVKHNVGGEIARGRKLSGGQVVVRVGRNGEADTDSRLGLQRVGWRTGHEIKAKLGLIGLGGSDGDVVLTGNDDDDD